MTRALIVIPARYASTRLPGKPLLAKTGKPLIVHVCEAAAEVRDADILVATDDHRIADAVTLAGFPAAMTRTDHTTGSARVAEAAFGRNADVVVNLQGDEPEVDANSIQMLIASHRRAQRADRPAFASTLVSQFPRGTDPMDPNTVKAVLSKPGATGELSALYFSRAAIPHYRPDDDDRKDHGPFLHIGLYAFTPDSLRSFAAMPPTPLERAESLEQLRILENGHRIGVSVVPPAMPGIDTPADYAAFVLRKTT